MEGGREGRVFPALFLALRVSTRPPAVGTPPPIRYAWTAAQSPAPKALTQQPAEGTLPDPVFPVPLARRGSTIWDALGQALGYAPPASCAHRRSTSADAKGLLRVRAPCVPCPVSVLGGPCSDSTHALEISSLDQTERISTPGHRECLPCWAPSPCLPAPPHSRARPSQEACRSGRWGPRVGTTSWLEERAGRMHSNPRAVITGGAGWR